MSPPLISFLQFAGVLCIGLLFVAWLMSLGTPFMVEKKDERGRHMWFVYTRQVFSPRLEGSYFTEASASKHVHDILQRRRKL
jgi:hypothetical protein